MAVINPIELGISIQIKKKIGHAWGYGEKIYGQIRYGATMILHRLGRYGMGTRGETKYGDVIERHGIYQIRSRYNGSIIVKEKFYLPTNPQTETQQTHRQKLTDAVAGWQGLTNNQKEIYNEIARYKPYSGYNLYIGEYILSH